MAGQLGLSSVEAQKRLAEFGPNSISTHHFTPFGVLLRQLKNPILLLLISAAIISGVLGDIANATEIGVIVLLSVGLSFITEFRAEQANADLHSRVYHKATVIRDGVPRSIDASQLVVGDVVRLSLGSVIAADMTLVSVQDLQCDESVITGESIPTDKKAGDKVLMGTVVKSGSAEGLITLTGSKTEFGVIATRLGARVPDTDFQRGLSRFSVFLLRIALSTTALVVITNLVLQRPIVESLLYALALAVGMTPQLLPAIVSTALAIGSKQLAKVGVLVKRLVSIEDLGDLDILLTDKTGTLTAGAVAFESALTLGKSDVPMLGLLATDANYDDARTTVAGLNPLDAALWSSEAVSRLPKTLSRLDSIPFDHDRRIVSSLVEIDGEYLIVAKGSPEDVMRRCSTFGDEAKTQLTALYERGARVIAVASKKASGKKTLTVNDETGLTLEGFLVFSDPPKPSVQKSLKQLADLGIEVKIATGDSAEVAIAVCRGVGIDVKHVITGEELAKIPAGELAIRVSKATIFARVSPEQKAEILKALRSTGKSIGFLGDGVNDAIALHDADVGISVDSGADVAKDAADVVLLEKDLEVLAKGVSHGRRVFSNTMKYVLMGTAGDFGNLFSAALGTMVLPFLPMAPGQVLLQDLLYDTSQLAIPSDRVDPEQLARPSHWNISYIRKFMVVFGLASSIFDFMTFGLMLYIFKANEAEFHTGWFVESLATATLIGFAIRTKRVPFFTSRPSWGLIASITGVVTIGFVLPYTALGTTLGFTALPWSYFLALMAMVFAYVSIAEIAKRRLFPSNAQMPSTRAHAPHRHFMRRAARFRTHTRR